MSRDRTQSPASRYSPWITVATVFLLWSASAIAAQAQSIPLQYFNGSNGDEPLGRLIQATDGNFYGTTTSDSTTNGNVFKATPTGTALTSLYKFCKTDCSDGARPSVALVQGSDGNLYGTTGLGGANNTGTFFQLTLGGTLTTLLSFNTGDGVGPAAALVQGTDGNFYGAGAGGTGVAGRIFKITPTGTFSTLYSFTDGGNPTAELIQGSDGAFYGTTHTGGVNGGGSVFRVTPTGTLTTLYSFCSQTTSTTCTDGNNPTAGVIQGLDGNFYGTTANGGLGYGTVFKVTPTGTFTSLYSFCPGGAGCGDGQFSYGGLIEAQPGIFLGTAQQGGANAHGIVYEITSAGVISAPLYSFCSQTACNDGRAPYAGLTQGADGFFYGTTQLGGTADDGTVFSIDSGLSPFLFTLSAGPNTVTVAQSGSNTSTITVNPRAGFLGTVDLTASGLPSGVTASFNPTSTATTSVVTLTASAGAATGTAEVTITGISGSETETAAINVTVAPPGRYSLSAGQPSSATISAGGSSTAAITLASAGGYTGTVTLSCSILPAVSTGTPTCSFGGTSPATVTSSGGTATLTFTTVAPSRAAARLNAGAFLLLLPLPGLAWIGLSLGWRDSRKKLLGLLLLAIAMGGLTGLSACGSGNGGGGKSGGTPAGAYTITVTGQDGFGESQSNTSPVTVTINVS